MSDEFFRVARQEIQSEIDSLQDIFLVCVNDQQLYERSRDIEKHMHKIKGLAPMMGQKGIGEIARICDIIVKHVTSQGVLKGSHKIISNAVQRIHHLFNEQVYSEIEDFKKQAKDAFPQISGL